MCSKSQFHQQKLIPLVVDIGRQYGTTERTDSLESDKAEFQSSFASPLHDLWQVTHLF